MTIMTIFSSISIPITIPIPMQKIINPRSLPTFRTPSYGLTIVYAKTPQNNRKLYRISTIKLLSILFMIRFPFRFPHHCFCQTLEAKRSTKSWHHIKNLGKSILILYIDKLGSSILDNQHCTRCQFSCHSAAMPLFFLSLSKAPAPTPKENIHQREDDRISNMDCLSHYSFGRNKCVHSFKKRIYSILKIVLPDITCLLIYVSIV